MLLTRQTSSSLSPASTPSGFHYEREMMIEIEDVVSKLIRLRKSGNMREYEDFLQPVMRKYCVDHLSKSYFAGHGAESFHMNVAKTISFLSQGGTFTEHSGLEVTVLCGIVNVNSARDEAQPPQRSCPLLSGLYELGAPNALREVDADQEVEDAADSVERDFEGRFDGEF